jgi:hypothetical protein
MSRHKTILLIDVIVNLLLGIRKLLFPLGIDAILGLPEPAN